MEVQTGGACRHLSAAAAAAAGAGAGAGAAGRGHRGGQLMPAITCSSGGGGGAGRPVRAGKVSRAARRSLGAGRHRPGVTGATATHQTAPRHATRPAGPPRRDGTNQTAPDGSGRLGRLRPLGAFLHRRLAITTRS